MAGISRLLVTGLLSVTFTGVAFAQSADERLAKAHEEGQVVVYTAQNQPFMEGLTKRFEADVPGIDMQVMRAPSPEILARLVAEQDAGRAVADLYIAWWDTAHAVVDKGYAAEYVPADIDSFPSVRDPAGKWMAVAAYPSVIGYNTKNVPPDQAPKNYMDLTDPKWKGRIGLADPRVGGGPYGYYHDIWNLHGLDFFSGVAKNEPFILTQAAALVNGVGAGQFDISIAGAANWLEAAASGAPVALAYPEDGVSLTYFVETVLAKAPHPNAARVFLDWLVSEKGQQAIATVPRAIYPLRAGVPSPEGYPQLSDLKIAPMDFDEFLAKQKEITDEVSTALGLAANN